MTILVTGATGHVGANVVRELVSRGHHVRAMVEAGAARIAESDSRALSGLSTEQVPGDVTKAETVARAVEGAEVVYHLAAKLSLDGRQAEQMAAVNVAGTRNVVSACLRFGVRRLVHFSSIHAVRDLGDGPVNESAPSSTGPDSSAYDRTKAAAEMEVLQGVRNGLDAVIVMPTGVIGPYDFGPSPVGRGIWRLYRGEMRLLVEGGFDWVDARDVARGALAAAAHGRSGQRYILSGHSCSLVGIASIVDGIRGVPTRRFVVPWRLAMLGSLLASRLAAWSGQQPLFTAEAIRTLQRYRRVVHAKASRELRYEPRPLQETLADTIAWMCRHRLGAPSRPAIRFWQRPSWNATLI